MSSSKTKEALNYILVDNQESALYEEVEEQLQKGWKLYGYPFSHDGKMCQCLILSNDQNQQSDIEYILVDDIEVPLNAEVAEMLSFGWELYGYPFSHNGVLVQCLITKKNTQATPTE